MVEFGRKGDGKYDARDDGNRNHRRRGTIRRDGADEGGESSFSKTHRKGVRRRDKSEELYLSIVVTALVVCDGSAAIVLSGTTMPRFFAAAIVVATARLVSAILSIHCLDHTAPSVVGPFSRGKARRTPSHNHKKPDIAIDVVVVLLDDDDTDQTIVQLLVPPTTQQRITTAFNVDVDVIDLSE